MFKDNYKIFNIIRGLAITLMVLANAAPLFKGDFPIFMRILFSIPAPTFVMVSGIMLAIVTPKHNYAYFLSKGAFIFALGALNDLLIYKLVPLEGFDILYLIGISIPIVALILRLSLGVMCLGLVAILALAELSRWHFGYTQGLPVNDLSLAGMVQLLKTGPDFKQWLINGWFPLLPWTGVMLFGAILGKFFLASNHQNYFQSNPFRLKFAIMILLVPMLFYLLPEAKMYTRDGYSELFYPAHSGLMIPLLIVAMSMLAFSKHIQNSPWLDVVFGRLGSSSLAIYLFHLFIINWVTKNMLGSIMTLEGYVLVYVLHLIAVHFFAYLLNRFKQRHSHFPAMVSWLIGK